MPDKAVLALVFADFIVTLEGRRFAVEAKAQVEVHESAVLALEQIRSGYEKTITPFVVHLGARSKKVKGIWCHPWQVLLRELGL